LQSGNSSHPPKKLALKCQGKRGKIIFSFKGNRTKTISERAWTSGWRGEYPPDFLDKKASMSSKLAKKRVGRRHHWRAFSSGSQPERGRNRTTSMLKKGEG